MNRLSRWNVRALYVSCLIVVPFLRFLAVNEYGFLYPEVLAAVGLLVLECVLLGMVARGVWFYVLTALCAAIVATYPSQQLASFLSAVPWWVLACAVAGVTFLLAWRMQEKFFIILAVFAWSGLLVELVSHGGRTGGDAGAGSARSSRHVLWLILDEHIGLAGFPSHPPECVQARERLQGTLDRYNFTSFPNAYSNYAATMDSVPSILNHRLAPSPGALMPRVDKGWGRHYAAGAASLLEDFSAAGYHVVGWQNGSVRFCVERRGYVDCEEYNEKLKWLHRYDSGWVERFRWLIGTYQSCNPLLLRARGFFPFRFGVKAAWPLSPGDRWPQELAARLRAEPRRTLFVVHLLLPHSPYLFRSNGTIRPVQEWAGDPPGHRLGERGYESIYGRYCEQTEFVARQLDCLLRALEAGGMLYNMTVVVHGDHGSRILRRTSPDSSDGPGGADTASPDRLDFTQPDSRDLLDRFSALLAIKSPGATAPAVCSEKHSLLTFLSRLILHRDPADGEELADKVYLADDRKQFHAIAIQQFWR